VPVRLRRAAVVLGAAVASVVAVTPIVVVLEQVTDIENASPVYLVAVVASAVAAGPMAGVASALLAVAAYNLLFTEPRFTLLVHETGDWLTLLLLLGVGSVVGELAGTQRSRAEAAARREREARTLVAATRALVATNAFPERLGAVTELLRRELGPSRVWIDLFGTDAETARVAEADPTVERMRSEYVVLQRSSDGERWTQVRRPGPPGSSPRPPTRRTTPFRAWRRSSPATATCPGSSPSGAIASPLRPGSSCSASSPSPSSSPFTAARTP